jgi:hypothetical protein
MIGAETTRQWDSLCQSSTLVLRPFSHWGDATAIRWRENHFTVAYWSSRQFVMAFVLPARPRYDDDSPWIKCSRLFSWSNRSRVASVGERPLAYASPLHVHTALSPSQCKGLMKIGRSINIQVCVIEDNQRESKSSLSSSRRTFIFKHPFGPFPVAFSQLIRSVWGGGLHMTRGHDETQ